MSAEIVNQLAKSFIRIITLNLSKTQEFLDGVKDESKRKKFPCYWLL